MRMLKTCFKEMLALTEPRTTALKSGVEQGVGG